ncbi:hypothetical protein HYALB_00009415 [Hymenoscyphus albidus]|uniref:AB hydrolase-1 domain-containing protein n=1 Tax=Hymenoscyphus albidus TaxID=595503 RepID=A0A9N9LMJ7_9HELO|nr:hypothetical protein HYALB_00009415 [Hymenoscyphus albidus]
MSNKDFAIEYVCQKRMHQSFTIPGTENRNPLKVTYATAGLENDDAPTIVFISGMYGMRWIALLQHHIALKVGVRLVCVDRPSFGGSTPVPISERISTWLQTIPHLLSHLKCSHVVPIAASAGIVFLLNTLYHMPFILPPKSPYSVILAPWVHPKNSNAAMMSFVASNWMPKALVEKHWDNVSGFVATKLLPGFAASGGLMEGIAAAAGSNSSGCPGSTKAKKQKQDHDDEMTSMELYGMTCAQRNEVENLGLKYMFAENTSGANDEALLCLRKGKETDVGWGVCEDYVAFVPKLAEKWKKSSGDGESAKLKLRLQVYYAASDAMSGEGGRKFFEECWREDKCGDAIEFLGSTVPDTSHDSIGFSENGVLEKVFREAKKALETV